MGKEPVLAGSGWVGEMGKEPVLAGSGRAGEMGYASGFDFDCGLAWRKTRSARMGGRVQ